MFKRLFRRRHDETGDHLHIPEVDEVPNIEELFEKARKAAAGEGEQTTRATRAARRRGNTWTNAYVSKRARLPARCRTAK